MESRVIKFRAWDYCADKMLDWDFIVKGFDLSVFNRGDIVMMLFAGLKDKNGKDIYDGDMVKFHYFYAGGGLEGFREAEHELTGVVKWGFFGWGVEAIKGEHWEGYTGYNAGEGDANFMELLAMNESGIHEESFEIIGNIYENPELVK